MWGNPTLLNLLKKYWEKIIKYWLSKVNIAKSKILLLQNNSWKVKLGELKSDQK